MKIEPFYDPATNSLTYVVSDPNTHDAVVIDPVLDYDPASSTVSTASVDRVDAYLRSAQLRLIFILETHAHADHLSGSQALKRRFPGAQIAIGRRITEVQRVFKEIFDLPEDFPTDGRQFDRLLVDREVVAWGSSSFEVIATPGHTPACAMYRFGDAIFTGDAMFMPDMGTGRCDFPAGSASDLYDSITTKIYTLPDETRMFVGHDYQPGGRPLAHQTTVRRAEGAQRAAARRAQQGRVRGVPRASRRRAGHAASAVPERAGQRRRRHAPGRVVGRAPVPEDPDQRVPAGPGHAGDLRAAVALRRWRCFIVFHR